MEEVAQEVAPEVDAPEVDAPDARAKVQPAAKPQLDRYAYLPTDLQRAAVFMTFCANCRKASMIASTGTSRRRDRHR